MEQERRRRRRTSVSSTAEPELTPTERAEHCIAWIEANCKILSDTGAGVIPFALFDYQKQFIRDFWTHRELICLKARQLGMTETVAAIAVYCVTVFAAWTIIILSKDQDAANEVLSKCRIAYDYLPDSVKVPVINPAITSTLKLTNRSRIIPKPTSPGAGRSFNAQVLILDEWAHQMWQDQVYAAASPVARSAGNKIIGLSTANGVGNFFHKQWTFADRGEGMHPIFLPWHARPGRDAQWYANATRGYEEWQKAQEFPQNAEEAFILSGRPVFNIDAIEQILQVAQEPIAEDDNGALRIWEQPTQMGQYVVGADVAEGLLKGDYSAAVVIDVHSGREVACLHGHWPPAVFAHHLNALGRRYNNAHLGVERNNQGHAVLLALVELHQYPALYWHRDYDATGTVERAGWPTTTKTKPIMIDALGATFRERRPWRNRHMLAEARTYTYDDNGGMGASGDLHDDLVVCYCIAEMVRTYRPTQTYVEHEIETLGLADFVVETRY